jgi:myo-inositol catabolism protein IolC
MTRGYDRPLYFLPFDHRGSFKTGMFGWKGAITPEQTAQIVATKQAIYDAFKSAIAGGVRKEEAGILVDEQFGADILRDARAQGYTTACPAEKSGQEEFDFEYGEDCEKIVAVARQDGRDKVSCIILGRGEDDKKVREWLLTASGVPGFIGFAVGRTSFWEPLVSWRAGKITRDSTVNEIAYRYREFVDIFESARVKTRVA